MKSEESNYEKEVNRTARKGLPSSAERFELLEIFDVYRLDGFGKFEAKDFRVEI